MLFVAMFVVLALTGGSSRADAETLFLLRPLLVLVAAGLLVLSPGELAPRVRIPGVLLGLLAAVIAAQLVPLPPALWVILPSHAGDAPVAGWLGEPQPWRPSSLVPVLTWNSLLALLPAATALIAISRLDRGDLGFVVLVLLGCGVFSALLGVVQIGSGLGYLFSRNSPGLPTGIFANRNHQAAFLAGLLPVLATWAVAAGRHWAPGLRYSLAGIVATLFAITILITGSRTGLLLAILDLAVAGSIVLRAMPKRQARRSVILLAAVCVALAGLVGAAVYLGRGGGIDRFSSVDAGADIRIQAFPVVRRLVLLYLPWGSGFGTFDPLYRMYEPDQLLNPTYFNNAHNDLMELALTGGVPALLILAALLGWLGWHSVRAGREWWRAGRSWSSMLLVAAAMMAVTWLIASLPDYPLRTPLAGASFAIACCLATKRRERGRSL